MTDRSAPESREVAQLRVAMEALAENPHVSEKDFAAVCDAHLAVSVALFDRLDVMSEALRELEAVPDAGPFANKGACRAFAGYVQTVARRGLAAALPERQEEK